MGLLRLGFTMFTLDKLNKGNIDKDGLRCNSYITNNNIVLAFVDCIDCIPARIFTNRFRSLSLDTSGFRGCRFIVHPFATVLLAVLFGRRE